MTTFKQHLNEEIKPPRLLAIDLDGVLCDFMKGFNALLGDDAEDISTSEYEAKHGKNSIWEVIDPHGVDFWTGLDWMPDGKKLWTYVKPYNPTILSAPSRKIESKIGKTEWLRNNIPELPNHHVQTKGKRGWDGSSKIILNSMKHLYANGPEDILIDDTPSKIEAWRSAGGTGILHTSANSSIAELKKLGL